MKLKDSLGRNVRKGGNMNQNEQIKILEILKAHILIEFNDLREHLLAKETHLNELLDHIIYKMDKEINEELKELEEIEAQSRKAGVLGAASGS